MVIKRYILDNKDNFKKLNKNKLIRRRRIFFFLRMIFIFFIFVIFLLVFVNSSIFSIKNIKLFGNKFLEEEYILQELNGVYHKNLLFYSIDKDLDSLKSNKYVRNIKYTKKLPNTLNLYIDEKNIDYYIYSNNKYYVFDRDAILVDILDYKQDNVLEITKVKLPSDLEIGERLFDASSREVQWMKNLSELFDLNNSDIHFDYIDFSNVYNVVLGYKDIKINIGNNSDLRQKLNIAINVINSNPKFQSMQGYIDVRAKGHPVLSLE